MSDSEHLDQVVRSLAAHFPDVPRGEVDEVVHGIYAELSKEARVTEHLPALVESEARDVLESRSAGGGTDRTS